MRRGLGAADECATRCIVVAGGASFTTEVMLAVWIAPAGDAVADDGRAKAGSAEGFAGAVVFAIAGCGAGADLAGLAAATQS